MAWMAIAQGVGGWLQVMKSYPTHRMEGRPGGRGPGAQWLLAVCFAAGGAMAAPSPLVINEVQPLNLSTVEDGAGEPDPWVEIYNTSSSATVSLDGYFLTTNYANLARWRFPAGQMIGPGRWLVVWADGEPHETVRAELHAGFRLPSQRGSVALSRLVGALPEVVDFLDYDHGVVGPDLSLGAYPDGGRSARPLCLAPTPGGPNLSTPLTVLINEWQPFGATGGPGWFEVYNPGVVSVDLAGSYLTDEPSNPTKFSVPPGRILSPKGFLRVWADDNPQLNASDPLDLHVNFRLGSGFIGLSAADRTPGDSVFYPQLPTGAAQGRFPDGARFIYAANTVTPRASNISPPYVIEPPASQTVVAGQDVTFRVRAQGTLPMSYEWRHNETVIVPNGGPELKLPAVSANHAGSYDVVIANQAGVSQSVAAILSVQLSPILVVEPVDLVVPLGRSARFTATLNGTPPFTIQWRLNGVAIPGATDNVLSIQSVQLENAGTYEVVVANAAGAVSSRPLRLALDLQGPPVADDFEARVFLESDSGLISGGNQRATREPDEPDHAGKRGGKSVWYTWRAPVDRVATFHTRGSGFDTLLAVYTGDKVSNLAAVASDDERGRFHTSLVQFNALRSVEYQIAVDGFAGAEGDFLLSWSLDDKAGLLPVVTMPPTSQTVELGQPVTFGVTTVPAEVQFQWLHNGRPIPGADGRSLRLEKATLLEAGFYSVLVRYRELTVESLPATLEIGPVAEVQSQDKRPDLALNDPRPLKGGVASSGAGLAGFGGGVIGVSLGTIVSHTLSNQTNSVTDLQEVNHCGHITYATRWLDFQTDHDGVCLVHASGMLTNGAPFPLLVAVYALTNFDEVLLLTCATNGTGSEPAIARFDAQAGLTYLAVVDGLDGATGFITLEWLLGAAPAITQPVTNYVVPEGDNLSLTVNAAGWVPAPEYQWRLDGAALPGGTGSTLALLNLQAADQGAYSVVVSNAIGQAVPPIANVQVEIPLRVQLFTDSSPPGQGALNGMASQAYWILSSTNLECWMPLMLISNAPFTLNQPVALGPAPPWTFYRAAPWPVAPWDEVPLCE